MDLSYLQSRASTSTSSSFPPHRTQLHPRMYFSSSSPSSSTYSRAYRLRLIAAGLFVFPFLLYLFFVARRAHLSARYTAPRPKCFGVIIDAGASASRVRVFEFLNEGRIPFVAFDGKGSVSMSVRSGLREFAVEPERARVLIRGLLEFAKRRVPRAAWGDTKVRLIENGGLEGLEKVVRRGILESCSQELRASGFSFRNDWASSITGQEKGIYAWVAANYALGTLGANHKDTMGVIELGDTSTQVTFVTSEQLPMEFSRLLRLPGMTYKVYSSSTNYYSQDRAWESLHKMWTSRLLTKTSNLLEESVMFPCIPKGYNQTSDHGILPNFKDRKIWNFNLQGNFKACRGDIHALFQEQDTCTKSPCEASSIVIPTLQGKHFSTQNFFFTSELFGLTPRTSLLDVEKAGQHYCEDHWSKLKQEHFGIDEADLLKYCFSSAFIVALLHDILGISLDEKRIGFMNPVESVPHDWTLGAFILQTITEPLDAIESPPNIVGSGAISYMPFFAVLVLAVLSVFFISKCRRPQLKTIYDLEKGRYIVTRIPR
ncbi:hypothetical protein KFK09_012607 [Dendrobium nobile]|uniref:Apyrase 6 n=1 Tax=Dendrobium nobile TaxID=94219 RepID=A0A8T3BHU9_DENNO|nr:hypothetical protein KFK09_012607 [Dendrobium nobile]